VVIRSKVLLRGVATGTHLTATATERIPGPHHRHLTNQAAHHKALITLNRKVNTPTLKAHPIHKVRPKANHTRKHLKASHIHHKVSPIIHLRHRTAETLLHSISITPQELNHTAHPRMAPLHPNSSNHLAESNTSRHMAHMKHNPSNFRRLRVIKQEEYMELPSILNKGTNFNRIILVILQTKYLVVLPYLRAPTHMARPNRLHNNHMVRQATVDNSDINDIPVILGAKMR
jgi:hypothetical protein